jgi:tetratricopeptide (TPR) repeat protein
MSRTTRRRASAAAFVVLIPLVAWTAVAQPKLAPLGESPAALIERATTAYAQGRYQDALETARRAADAAPRLLPAQLLRGEMAEFMGEFDEAGRTYAQAKTLAPDNNTVRYRAATFATRIGDYDRALRELDAILATEPKAAQLFFRWAPPSFQNALLKRSPALAQFVDLQIDILMEKGDLAGARSLAQRHGIVEPGRDYCADANRKKASKRSSPDDVFKAFRLAALGQPDSADCIWWYGQWLTDEGYMRLGRLMVEEGTRLTPSPANKESGNRFVRIRLGGAHPIAKRAESLFMIAKQRYLRDGDVEGAARLFDESLRVSPTFARPYAYKARMARDDGDREAALGWLRRGVEADPESWRTWHNLGRLLLVAERWDEAAPTLTRAVALFPDDVGGRLALARALYAVGDWAGYHTHTEYVVKLMRGLRDAKAVDDLAKFSPKVQLVDDPEDFFAKFQRWGPGAALPPMPDPSLIIGWNQD